MMCVWEYPEYSLLNCCQILNLETEGISLDEYFKNVAMYYRFSIWQAAD